MQRSAHSDSVDDLAGDKPPVELSEVNSTLRTDSLMTSFLMNISSCCREEKGTLSVPRGTAAFINLTGMELPKCLLLPGHCCITYA